MPKITDLPQAPSIKDNDSFYMVDPDTDTSFQIAAALFRRQIAKRNLLYGQAAQNMVLNPGVRVQVTGYQKSLEHYAGGAAPITGELVVQSDGILKIRTFLQMTLGNPTNTDSLYLMELKVDNGVTPVFFILDEILGMNIQTVSVAFNSSPTIDVIAGDILSLHLSSSNVTQSMNINDSTFMSEVI